MAPTLVLTYFDIRGAAEPIRWAMEQGGLEWIDNRLSKQEFGTLKPSLPNGQLPVLDVDGFQLAQSLAILRYVGKLGGLYPTEDLEAAKCDAIMDSAVDYRTVLLPSYMEQDEVKKMEMRAELATNVLPKMLGGYEKQLSSTKGIFFGDKMTVADILTAFNILHLKSGMLDGIPTTIVDAFPALSALFDSIIAEPKIAAFIAKHSK